MTDPLDILRAEKDRTEPDPEFRARIMMQLRESLAADRPQIAAHRRTQTGSHEEGPTLGLSGSSRNDSRRGFAAAFVGLAAAMVLIVVLANVPRKAQPPIGDPPTGATAPASTVVPATTAATTTTSATTTTTVFVNPLSDADIAANMLLEPSEYAPGWTLQADIAVKTLTLDRTLAASVTGCADFLDTVFESNNRPATIEGRGFQAPPGPAAVMGQYVVVFPTENNAQEMFDALLDPRFSGDCLDPYFALTDLNGDEFCCDTTEPATPALFGEPVAPTTDIDADQIAFRSDTQYWEDFSGAMHGPETVVSATARIGRTITIIEAITVDEFGEPFITEDQFHTAITTAVARARDALSEVATG